MSVIGRNFYKISVDNVDNLFLTNSDQQCRDKFDTVVYQLSDWSIITTAATGYRRYCLRCSYRRQRRPPDRIRRCPTLPDERWIVRRPTINVVVETAAPAYGAAAADRSERFVWQRRTPSRNFDWRPAATVCSWRTEEYDGSVWNMVDFTIATICGGLGGSPPGHYFCSTVQTKNFNSHLVLAVYGSVRKRRSRWQRIRLALPWL